MIYFNLTICYSLKMSSICDKCKTFEIAMKNLHLGCMNQFEHLTSRDYFEVYNNDNVVIFDWLINIRSEFHMIKYKDDFIWIEKYLAIKGSVKCLERLIKYDKQRVLSLSCILGAFETENIKSLEFFRNKGYEFTESEFNLCAMMGKMKCLTFLMNIQCPCSTKSITFARLNNHINCVEYLKLYFEIDSNHSI